MLRCKSLKIAEIEINGVKLSNTFEILQYIGKQEERIAELEATNKKISDECHKLVDSLEKKQKENAELKEENESLESIKNIYIGDLLKAKKYIRELTRAVEHSYSVLSWQRPPIKAEAEQFLNSEVDK